jgi:hypothetical protein
MHNRVSWRSDSLPGSDQPATIYFEARLPDIMAVPKIPQPTHVAAR